MTFVGKVRKGNSKKISAKYFFAVIALVFAAAMFAQPTAANQTKRVAVVMFNFQNDNSQPYTVDYARNMVFGTINSYYKEASFGKLSLEGDVFGWYTIPYSSTSCQYKIGRA